jgi:hypothetical protein
MHGGCGCQNGLSFKRVVLLCLDYSSRELELPIYPQGDETKCMSQLKMLDCCECLESLPTTMEARDDELKEWKNR